MSSRDRLELLQGTLDLLILRTLQLGPAHGHTIAKAIERKSGLARTGEAELVRDPFAGSPAVAPPTTLTADGLTRAEAVAAFREDLLAGRLRVTVQDARHELRGRELACWCPLDQPCHADVLLEVANG